MIKFSFFRTRQNKTRVKNIKSIKYIKIYRILLFMLSSLKLYFFNHKILKILLMLRYLEKWRKMSQFFFQLYSIDIDIKLINADNF